MYISNSNTGFTQWPWKFWIMDNSHLWFLNICSFTYTAVKKLYLYICWCIISSLKTELIFALSCQQVSFFSLLFLVSWNNPFFGRISVFFHSHFCILKNAFKIIFYLMKHILSRLHYFHPGVIWLNISITKNLGDLSHFLLKTAWNYSWECWYYFEGFFFFFFSAKK